jgi:hypothetical protein
LGPFQFWCSRESSTPDIHATGLNEAGYITSAYFAEAPGLGLDEHNEPKGLLSSFQRLRVIPKNRLTTRSQSSQTRPASAPAAHCDIVYNAPGILGQAVSSLPRQSHYQRCSKEEIPQDD